MTDKKKTGRPSSYTKEIGDKICGQLAEGKSLREICRQDGYPTPKTVRSWARMHTDTFLPQYAQARADQADYYAEEIVDIADTEPDPQRAKVRMDARKWTAARMAPRKWGDRVLQEVTGKDGGPVESKIEIEFVGMDEEDVMND